MKEKDLVWVGNSLRVLKGFPESIKDSFGYALHVAQFGKCHKNTKMMKGFKPQVMEVVTDFDSDTYRAIYTAKIGETIYVLHCFQKKSKSGIKTPKEEIELIKQRLKQAQTIHREGKLK